MATRFEPGLAEPAVTPRAFESSWSIGAVQRLGSATKRVYSMPFWSESPTMAKPTLDSSQNSLIGCNPMFAYPLTVTRLFPR